VNRFNPSEWALGHRSFVLYLMLAVAIAGFLSCQRLDREEDSAFTIRTMVVQANWSGATAEEMTSQVTDRIERKLQELSNLDYTRSYSTAGQTTIFVNLKDTTRARDVPSTWVQVRNKVSDIRAELPQGIQGPFFDDQFGDVFGTIYAFTSDGLSFRQLRDYVEKVRTEILTIPAAGRVDLLGAQDGTHDPPQPLFRFDGQPAIGLAIGMKSGNNLIEFGNDLRARMRQIVADLPIGIGVHLVSNQPAVAEEAVDGITLSLLAAVIVVFAVGFLSLGLRAGLVVAIAISLVLAGTFVFMEYAGIALQRISLGGLIIALGLLVDDAVISVEMMVARREEGSSLEKAATFAYASTAFPMLTGTLVTVAGFLPIWLNGGAAGEYALTLFAVIACALLISWIVAVLFTPLLGVALLPRTVKSPAEAPSRLKRRFREVLLQAMRRRWLTIAVAVGLFALSVGGLGLVRYQFLPAADRPELLVDLTLPPGFSIAETKAQMERFEKALTGDADIVHWSSFVGRGAVRFYPSLDEQLGHPNFGQIVIVAKDLDARLRLADRLEKRAHDDFVGIDIFVHPLGLGSPAGRPIQYRIGGPDIQTVRRLMLSFAEIVASPNTGKIVYDWNEPFRGRDGQPVVWRRNRQPTITLQASVVGTEQPATVVERLAPAVEKFRSRLPPGYTVEVGGSVEENGKWQQPIADAVPPMLFLVATVLMIQLQSFRKLFLAASVAPLGLIGVVAALLIGNQPLGFVTILGVLVLIGILLRNSVVLMARIDAFRANGLGPWEAVVEATQHRLRPILLTAAAASLGMIPIAADIVWRPMAIAMIGGMVVATALTLLFLPALYVTWYRIQEPQRPTGLDAHAPVSARMRTRVKRNKRS
jgi:multidrug efflux pump subunit AcrB